MFNKGTFIVAQVKKRSWLSRLRGWLIFLGIAGMIAAPGVSFFSVVIVAVLLFTAVSGAGIYYYRSRINELHNCTLAVVYGLGCADRNE